MVAIRKLAHQVLMVGSELIEFLNPILVEIALPQLKFILSNQA